jgi:hypothetical protein
MITTFAEMKQLELTPGQSLALEQIRNLEAQVTTIKKETSAIYADKAARTSTRLKKSESERVAFLNGQLEIVSANLDALSKHYADSIKDDLRRHIMDNYTIPVLKSAGLLHHLDLDNRNKNESLHSDSYYSLSLASAHCRVRFSLGTYGELRDVEFNTEENPETGGRSWYSIVRTWRAKELNAVFLGQYNISVSSMHISPGDDGHKIANLLGKVVNICDCFNNAVPTATGISYITHRLSSDELERIKTSYAIRATAE